jgi:hypothetical protein
MCHHAEKRASEFVEPPEESVIEERADEETEADRDEPAVRTTANADD